MTLSQKTDWPLDERRIWQLRQPEIIPQVNHVLKVVHNKTAQSTRVELGDAINDHPTTWTARLMCTTKAMQDIYKNLDVKPNSLFWGQQMMLEIILAELFNIACHVGVELDAVKQGPERKL